MIQLKHKGKSFELTDKLTTVELIGRDVKLADQVFGQPGEYESKNVEIVYGQSSCLVVWEHLQIVYIFSIESVSEFEKTQFSSSDVVIIGDETGEIKKDNWESWMGAYDPRLVFASPSAQFEAGLKSSLKFAENPNIKLSSANLPEEEREFYLTS